MMIVDTSKKQLWVLLIAEFLLMIGTSISQPFWPILIKSKIGTSHLSFNIWNTSVYLLPLLFSAISAPLWGSMADRYGYKKLFLRAAICLFIIQFLIGFASTPLEFCACRLLQGIFCGSVAAAQVYGTQLVSNHHKAFILTRLQASISLGTMVGPIVGGYVFSIEHYSRMFYISALACFIACILIILYLKEIPPSDKNIINTEQKSIIPKSIFLLSISIFLAQTSRFMMLPIFAIYITKLLHQPISYIGILYAATSITLFCSAPLMDKIFSVFKNSAIVPAIALLLSAFLFFSLELRNSPSFVFINRCLWGCCLAAITPLLYALCLQQNDQQKSGKIIGINSSANKLGSLVGILLSGYISFHFGVMSTIIVIGITYFINFFYILIINTYVLNSKKMGATQHVSISN